MTILSPSFSPSVAMVTCSGEGESFWDESPEMPLDRPLEAVEWLGIGDLNTGTLKFETGDLGGAILFGGTGLDIGERGTGERGVGDGETEERGVGEGRGMEVRAVGPDDGGFFLGAGFGGGFSAAFWRSSANSEAHSRMSLGGANGTHSQGILPLLSFTEPSARCEISTLAELRERCAAAMCREFPPPKAAQSVISRAGLCWSRVCVISGMSKYTA